MMSVRTGLQTQTWWCRQFFASQKEMATWCLLLLVVVPPSTGCNVGEECVPHHHCPSFLAQKAEWEEMERGTQERQRLLSSLKASRLACMDHLPLLQVW